MKQKVFLSSVQREFTQEREAVYRHLLTDPVLQLFFEPILFEKLPANGMQASAVYLKEVAQADVFLILIGKDYGFETPSGVSPTELEYDRAQEHQVFSLAFIKNGSEEGRHPKEEILFHKIQNNLSYKRFGTSAELVTEVTKALVVILQQKGILSSIDFDSEAHPTASLEAIDAESNSFYHVGTLQKRFSVARRNSVAQGSFAFKLSVGTANNQLRFVGFWH